MIEIPPIFCFKSFEFNFADGLFGTLKMSSSGTDLEPKTA